MAPQAAEEFGTSRFDVLGRYATALFRLAEEEGQLDRVAADVSLFDRIMNESPDLARLISDASIDNAKRAKILDEIFARAGLSDIMRRFVGLVIHKGRGGQFTGIIRNFSSLMAEHRGIMRVNVEAADALSPAQQDRLRDIFQAHFGRHVRIEFGLNSDLAGGLALQMSGHKMSGHKMSGHRLDASIAGKLKRLEKSIIKNFQTGS